MGSTAGSRGYTVSEDLSFLLSVSAAYPASADLDLLLAPLGLAFLLGLDYRPFGSAR